VNVVVGGGLAGLAAACALAEQGQPVTLVEQRPFVGGKTWSFRDEATGDEVDNGQHVFLGCCTEYKAFLARLGVADRVTEQRRLRVPILDPIHGLAILAGDPLPAPFHLLAIAVPEPAREAAGDAGAAYYQVQREERAAIARCL
jgi:phytoene dehydrogenase-like protein